MRTPAFYRFGFRAAAVWSWVVSLAYFMGDTFNEPYLRSLLPRVQPRFVLDFAVMPTFLFGFAFWWLARDLRRNHAVAAVGAAGSLLAFASIIVHASRGEAPPALVGAGIIDLGFGLLMADFLWWTRQAETKRMLAD